MSEAEVLERRRRGKAQARTMRAAVVIGPGQVRIDEVPLPEPGPGEVRIKLEGSGVCASNLTPWEGPEWMSFPTEPGGLGHEGWGIVDDVGEGVTEWKAGNRVAALSGHAYAEYDIADASALVRLPPELDGIAFPAEPFGCAMNIFRRSGISAGQTIAIVGIGFLGAVLTKLASNAGARVIARIKELTGGRLCDRVIEAVGKQWPLDLAAELTMEGGRLIIAGYHQDGARQVNMQLWNWRGFDVVNAHERDRAVAVRGMREAVEAVRSGLIDPALLITHRYPLDRLGEALNATRDRPGSFIKAIVEP